MLTYLFRRVPSAVAILFAASVVIFLILRAIPGDPATVLAGPDASADTIAEIRSALGLDESLVTQYTTWIGQVLTFDLGRSFVIGGEISDLVIDGLVNTLVLTGSALLIAVVLALCFSLSVVLWPHPWLKTASAAINTAAVALPPFVTGVLLVLVFAVTFRVLPAGGTPPDGFLARPDISIQYLILPALCLALPVAAALTRFLTEALQSELRKPYIATAQASGIPRWRIVSQSALRNALPTTLTVIGLNIGQLLGGAVLVEAIFAWPGIGQLIQLGINRRDYPVVQVLLLLSVAVFVAIQLLTDILSATLDPRIRLGGAS